MRGGREVPLLARYVATIPRLSDLVVTATGAVGLVVDHVEGVVIRLPFSKRDQEGHGEDIAIRRGKRPAICPVTALATWLDAAGITSGPVWRSVLKGGHVTSDRLSDRAVHLIVRRWTEAAGMDAADFGVHSLRAGLVTQMTQDGKPSLDISKQARIRQPMVERYTRHANRFQTAPDLGL